MKHKRLVGAAGLLTSAVTVVGLMAPLGVAAASAPTTFNATMGGRCVGNEHGVADSTFKVVWRDAGGALVTRQTVSTDEFGAWSVCAANHQLVSGDTIKATNDAGTHELVVPVLTIEVNRAHHFLSGNGPANDGLRLHCDFSNGFEPCIWTDGVRIGPNGYWSHNLPFSTSGGETWDAVWKSADGDRLEADAQTPFVTAEIGKAKVSGALAPGATRTIFLYDASMVRKGKAVVTGSLDGSGNDGSFSGVFRDADGNPVAVMPGDTIDASRVSSDATFVVPVITATATAPNDRVTGACENTPSSAGYANVYLYRTGKLRGETRFQGDGNDGVFSFNFRKLGPFDDEANVKPGDRLVIDCVQDGGDGALLTIFAN